MSVFRFARRKEPKEPNTPIEQASTPTVISKQSPPPVLSSTPVASSPPTAVVPQPVHRRPIFTGYVNDLATSTSFSQNGLKNSQTTSILSDSGSDLEHSQSFGSPVAPQRTNAQNNDSFPYAEDSEDYSMNIPANFVIGCDMPIMKGRDYIAPSGPAPYPPSMTSNMSQTSNTRLNRQGTTASAHHIVPSPRVHQMHISDDTHSFDAYENPVMPYNTNPLHVTMPEKISGSHKPMSNYDTTNRHSRNSSQQFSSNDLATRHYPPVSVDDGRGSFHTISGYDDQTLSDDSQTSQLSHQREFPMSMPIRRDKSSTPTPTPTEKPIMLPQETHCSDEEDYSQTPLRPFPSCAPFRAGELENPNNFIVSTVDVPFRRGKNGASLPPAAPTIKKMQSSKKDYYNSRDAKKSKKAAKKSKKYETESESEDYDSSDDDGSLSPDDDVGSVMSHSHSRSLSRSRRRGAQEDIDDKHNHHRSITKDYSNEISKTITYREKSVYHRVALQHFHLGSYIKERPNYMHSLVHCFEDAAIQIDNGVNSLSKLQKYMKKMQKAFASFAENFIHDDEAEDSWIKAHTNQQKEKADWARLYPDNMANAQIKAKNIVNLVFGTEDPQNKDMLLPETSPTYYRTMHDRAEPFVNALAQIQHITTSLAGASQTFSQSIEQEIVLPLIQNCKDLEERRKIIQNDLSQLKTNQAAVKTLSKKIFNLVRAARRNWFDLLAIDEHNEQLYSQLYQIDPSSSSIPSHFVPNSPHHSNVAQADSGTILRADDDGDYDDNTEETSVLSNGSGGPRMCSLSTNQGDDIASGEFPTYQLPPNRNNYTRPSIVSRMDDSHIKSTAVGNGRILSPNGLSYFSIDDDKKTAKMIKSEINSNEKRSLLLMTQISKLFTDIEANQAQRAISTQRLYHDQIPSFLQKCEQIERDRLYSTWNVLHRFYRIYATYIYQQTVLKSDQSCVSVMAAQMLDVISSFVGPRTLFGEYKQSIELLNIDNAIVNYIHDMQQPALLQQPHTILPCPATAVVGALPPSRRAFNQHNLIVQFFDPLFTDEADMPIHATQHTEQLFAVSFPAIPELPKIYRVVDGYNEQQCMKEHYQNILTNQRFSPSDNHTLPAPTITFSSAPPPTLITVDTLISADIAGQCLENQSNSSSQRHVLIESTASKFNTIYGNALNYTGFIVPPNSLVMEVPEDYFKLDAPHNKTLQYQDSNKLMISFTCGGVSGGSFTNGGNFPQSPFAASGTSSMSSIATPPTITSPQPQPDNRGLKANNNNMDSNIVRLTRTNSNLSANFQSSTTGVGGKHSDLAFLSAPQPGAEVPIRALEGLYEPSRYTFVETITLPGQVSTIANYLASITTGIPASQLVISVGSSVTSPTNAQNQSSQTTNPIPPQPINLHINTNSSQRHLSPNHHALPPPPPPPQIQATVKNTPSSTPNKSSAITILGNMPPPTTSIPKELINNNNNAPTVFSSPVPQPIQTNHSHNIVSAATQFQYGPGTPSRGYIPSHLLQPINLDESSIVMAQCLLYPRLGATFLSFLRTNMAAENIQYWSVVSRFRTTPWQLDHLAAINQLQMTLSDRLVAVNNAMAVSGVADTAIITDVAPSAPNIVLPGGGVQTNNGRSSRRASGHVGTLSVQQLGSFVPSNPALSQQNVFNPKPSVVNEQIYPLVTPAVAAPPTTEEVTSPPVLVSNRHRRTDSVQSFASNLISHFSTSNNYDDNTNPSSSTTTHLALQIPSQQYNATSPIMSPTAQYPPYTPSAISISKPRSLGRRDGIATTPAVIPSQPHFGGIISSLRDPLYPSTHLALQQPQIYGPNHAIQLYNSGGNANYYQEAYNQPDFLYSPEAFVEQALNIFHHFLTEGASREVNLPFQMVKPLRTLLYEQQLEFIKWKNMRLVIISQWEGSNPSFTMSLFDRQSGLYGHVTPANEKFIGISSLSPQQIRECALGQKPIIPPLKILLHRNIFLESEYEVYQLLSRDQFSRFKQEKSFNQEVKFLHLAFQETLKQQNQDKNSVSHSHTSSISTNNPSSSSGPKD